MNKKLILITIAILMIFAIGYTAYTGNYTGNFVLTESRTIATVSRVIDGDTFQLTDGTRVRLIGMDTEEKGERCYQEAKDRLKELIEGKDVFLEADKTDKDRYDRLLRYVYINDTFVNYLLVREGLARVYTIKPDVKYLDQFQQAFLLARNENGCIWRNS
jgi:micrococcal nuclease